MALDRLRASSPGGFSIYEQTGESAFLVGWIDCADAQFDLSTAVHESAHFIASETDMFPLVGGGAIERPHEVSAFYPPAAIADRFKHDDFAAIYLRGGKASSSGDFLYLLDELNAYSHDLATAVDLRALTAPDEAVDHRDGCADGLRRDLRGDGKDPRASHLERVTHTEGVGDRVGALEPRGAGDGVVLRYSELRVEGQGLYPALVLGGRKLGARADPRAQSRLSDRVPGTDDRFRSFGRRCRDRCLILARSQFDRWLGRR